LINRYKIIKFYNKSQLWQGIFQQYIKTGTFFAHFTSMIALLPEGHIKTKRGARESTLILARQSKKT